MTLTSRLNHGEWNDIFAEVSQGNGSAALTSEDYRTSGFNMFFMRHDQADTLHFKIQLPHSWMPGTAVKFHVHSIPMSTWVPGVASKNVYWEIYYFWSDTVNGIVPDAGVDWTTTNSTQIITPAQQFNTYKHNLCTISPPTTATESSILLLRVKRLGTDPLDTYNDNKTGGTGAANLAVIYFDLHYQIYKPGTINET